MCILDSSAACTEELKSLQILMAKGANLVNLVQKAGQYKNISFQITQNEKIPREKKKKE